MGQEITKEEVGGVGVWVGVGGSNPLCRSIKSDLLKKGGKEAQAECGRSPAVLLLGEWTRRTLFLHLQVFNTAVLFCT